MGPSHLLDARQVGQRPGHLEDPVVGAGREAEALGSLQEQRLAVAIRIDQRLDQRRAGGGVGEDLRMAGLEIGWPASRLDGRDQVPGNGRSVCQIASMLFPSGSNMNAS
jgi:hypothetical protein